MSDKTFLKITNRDIYDKLEVIEIRIGKINIKANVNSSTIAIIILILIAVLLKVI